MQEFVRKAQEFHRIRVEKGEEAFNEAVKAYVATIVESGNKEDLAGIGSIFVDTLKKEEDAYRQATDPRNQKNTDTAERLNNAKASPLEGDQGFLRVLQQSIPAMRSQAQFTAFMAAFDALRGVMNGIFSMDEAATTKFKSALEGSFEAAKKVTEITDKLHEVPEASESKLAEEFKKPPRQFGEYDLQRQLMSELAALDNLQMLTAWWTSNRQRIDEVRSPMLRNPLIDAVRAKKDALTSGV